MDFLIATQEIIVYRSPNEKWWWDHPELQLWLAGLVVMTLIGVWIMGKVRR